MQIAPTPEQQLALQFLQTSSSIATAEQLAAVKMNPNIPRYGQLLIAARVNWMKDQLFVLNYLRHIKDPNPMDILIDAQSMDHTIMESSDFRSLTQVEIQEAFNRGINGEYGEFYGITVASLSSFLRGYIKSEKWQKAKSIIYSEEQRKLQEEDKLYWKAIAEARERGLIDIPEFTHSPFEDDKQHKERIARQREEIIKQTKKDA